jgi:serine protease Do
MPDNSRRFRRAFISSLLVVFALAMASPIRAGAPAAPDGKTAKPAGANRVKILLSNGDKVEGSLLKKDDTYLYVYVGASVLRLPHSKIKDMKGLGKNAGLKEVKGFKLYKTAKLPARAVQALVKELGPAIAVVKTPRGMGTGWFCNRDGYLITNNHVVAGERSITVTMFHKEGEGFGKKVFKKVRIVALNDNIDLALLKIEEKIDIKYPQLYLGDSTKLKVGDKAFAIGNPLGLERSTSQGNISKTARNFAGRLYLQTTAPIAPGNSGGPLFNERGEVVGVINMGAVFFDGLGFAIPSKYVKEFLDNVEAFAYDQDNPNAGIKYMEVPVASRDRKIRFSASEFIKVGHGISCLTLADTNNNGTNEIVFVNNNKAEIVIARLRKKGEKDVRPDDFEEINRLPSSVLFKTDTIPVASRISSMAISDMNDDKLPDIVFIGDTDGLAVMEQKPDGSFRQPRKIDRTIRRSRRDALRIADIDGDGKKDLVVLQAMNLAVFRGGTKRELYPLNRSYSNRLKAFELLDVNGDKRLDIVFFSIGKHYATHVRLQNSKGQFIEERPLASRIAGPIRPCLTNGKMRFLTLDTGLNRIRELKLKTAKPAKAKNGLSSSLVVLPTDAGVSASTILELGDADADGRLELLALDQIKNSFLVYGSTPNGFSVTRSPSPVRISHCRLHTDGKGRAAVFSLSRTDKIFGVSSLKKGKVSYPRPINTSGQVEFLIPAGDNPSKLMWVEKHKSRYYVRSASTAALAASAFDGKKGSVDMKSTDLTFGPSADALKNYLPRKPAALAFGDFNGDDQADIVVYWSYSGKESLYLGMGKNRFVEIIKDQNFLDEQKEQPLIMADIDADGKKDVLLVKPGFVRVLRVDTKNKLYVEKQFNWEFDLVSQLTLYDRSGAKPRFAAVSGRHVKIVELDAAAGTFSLVGTIETSTAGSGRMQVGDVDGNGKPDILIPGRGTITISLNTPQTRLVESRMLLNAKVDYFRYWNLWPADMDNDGKEEVLLFDSRKAMFEIYRLGATGRLSLAMRHRLFEKTIFQRGQSDAHELPQELRVGDVDGNGKPDFVCILHDRVAIYLQDGK